MRKYKILRVLCAYMLFIWLTTCMFVFLVCFHDVHDIDTSPRKGNHQQQALLHTQQRRKPRIHSENQTKNYITESCDRIRVSNFWTIMASLKNVCRTRDNSTVAGNCRYIYKNVITVHIPIAQQGIAQQGIFHCFPYHMTQQCNQSLTANLLATQR